MKEFNISKNDSGQRIDKFISKAIPRLPQSMLYKYIRIKRIKINNKKCSVTDKLIENDTVQCYINDEFFEPVENKSKPDFLRSPLDLDIVYEDENIILVNKPAGLLVHDGNEWTPDTLIYRIQHYLYKKNEYDPNNENSFIPSLCNRIDRNTCGIVIAAKNAQTLRVLNDKIKNREIQKKYICIVKGIPKKQEFTLENYLLKDEKNNTVKVYDKPIEGAKTAITKYKTISSHDGMSLLEAELLTGRTHQIRAQLSHIGNPLIGDTKYGKASDGHGFTWQSLCSYKLTFCFSSESEHLDYLNSKTFSVKSAWFLDELGFKIPKDY